MVLQSEEQIKKASRYCEIAQSGVQSVYCAYNNVDSVTHNNTAIRLSLEHHKLQFCLFLKRELGDKVTTVHHTRIMKQRQYLDDVRWATLANSHTSTSQQGKYLI